MINNEIVAGNPYIAGGKGIMDWLPNAAETLKPGGQLIINGTKSNPYVQLQNAQTLEKLGLRIVQEKGSLLQQFRNQTFRSTEGGLIKIDKIKTTILEKVR